MAGSTFRVTLIDDVKGDQDHVISALKMCAGVSVRPFFPPADLDLSDISASPPHVFLIDYQLNQKHAEKAPPASYKGSTLAAALREQFEVTPIVLLTKRSLVQQQDLGAARDLEGAYDELELKEDVYRNPDSFVALLRILARGFQTLAKDTNGWDPVVAALKAKPSEEELFRRADPPERLLRGEIWRVAETARWIRHVLLRYPGIVYAPEYAAVTLGLARDAFLSDELQEYFSQSLYKGVFAPAEGRWWSGRLVASARALMRRARMQSAPLATFADAWHKVHRRRLQQAKCNTTGHTPADALCCILGTPVLREHSLPYRPDNRPACMEEARVSFKAIATRDDFDERLFPADARPIAEAISRGVAPL